jgi:hypothetical protein
MTLIDILSVTALSGFVASVVTLLGKGFIDWLNNKRDEQKIQREKLDKLIKRVFFLLDDLDREINKLRLIYTYSFKKDKKELFDFILNIENIANNKIINELQYIFDIKFGSVLSYEIFNISRFWEHVLFLIRNEIVTKKISLSDNPKKKSEGYSYEELENFLDSALNDASVSCGKFYSIFKLYFFAIKGKIIAFLIGVCEENKLTYRPKIIREIPDYIRYEIKKV